MKKALEKIFKTTKIWKFWVSCYYLWRGVRISPNARVMANFKNLKFSKKVKISKDVVLSIGERGCLVIGDDCWLSHGVEIESEKFISIGAGTTIQRRCSFNGQVKVGKGCIFAPNVFISSGTHIFRAWPELTIREQEVKYASLSEDDRPPGFGDMPVEIGDDCWIGVNAVIMPGVTLGRGCVIGANSVVTRSLPEFSVAAGAPATVKYFRVARQHS